jgi:hypothetical protein
VLKGQGHALRVRQGDVVEEILGEVAAIGVPVLAMGYHRGGPPGLAGGEHRPWAHAQGPVRGPDDPALKGSGRPPS